MSCGEGCEVSQHSDTSCVLYRHFYRRSAASKHSTSIWLKLKSRWRSGRKTWISFRKPDHSEQIHVMLKMMLKSNSFHQPSPSGRVVMASNHSLHQCTFQSNSSVHSLWVCHMISSKSDELPHILTSFPRTNIKWSPFKKDACYLISSGSSC